MASLPKLSPVMQQYLDMKSDNPGAVLLFRLGDFYEAFFDDAKIISSALELVLTQRGKDADGNDIPMCGIPWHAGENYLGRLVRAGLSVAIAEQMETPEQAKARGHKQIERKVVRVLTPGTLTDDNLLNPSTSNYLVAVTGLEFAGCDISTGELFVGGSESVFDDLVRLNPAEVIYPEHLAETPEIMRIRASFNTTPVFERVYQRSDISEIARRMLGENSDKPAILLLAGYLNATQRDAKIAFRASYKFGAGKQLLIDSATWKSLEIDASLNDDGRCLLDILDKTRTSAGARKLRGYLRVLSGDIGEIRMRQEHIGHLLLNRDLFFSFQSALMKVPDVGRALSRVLPGRGMPRDLRGVSEFLAQLPTLKMLGAKLDANLAERFADMRTHDEFAAELKSALNESLPAFFRDGNIIKKGFNDALDHMRQLAHGGKETIAALQSEYIQKTGINTLKIKYNGILGYHIEVPSARADYLMHAENGFIHRQSMANNMRFTTERLIDLDNDVRGAAEKATGIELEIIAGLIEKLRSISDDLLQTADLLAETDVWVALADAADEYRWTRPEITDDARFDIKAGRHPVIECVLKTRGDQFVRNDCNLEDKKIALLTGPNMAGKSTYLRQNAIIVVLAHLGSFVPADSATIGICDQLFSRVGASDNLAAGQSTFMVEMQETANILNRATGQSFIIFDEIGRGTATYDGMAIASAVLEFLDRLNPRTLFATHYHELTGLEFANVKNLTVKVEEDNNEIIFMHKILPGVANRSYGIHVAKMAGMPESVIGAATKILQGLESKIEKTEPVDIPKPAPVSPNSKVFVIHSPDETKKQMSLF